MFPLFFFQAEDGIRDYKVTGVQTCALPISLEMLRVVEDAAIASARTMGMGDANASDQAAVESMRRCLDTIAIDGTIVIGEGERDRAPMLYIGEKVGAAPAANDGGAVFTVDIAV